MSKELKPCPFCGAGSGMLYSVLGKDVHGFERPEIFCDACKASTYFEDGTSTGADFDEDMKKQEETLLNGWNRRETIK